MNAMIPDFYGPIHKAIRLALADFLVLAGASDASDEAAWAKVERGWKRIEGLLDAHSFHEDIHIHPMIHIAAPEIALVLDAQHAALDLGVRKVGEALAAMGALDDAEPRRRAGREVYLSFSAFVSDYFRHLIEEETRAMPALVAHFAPPALFSAHKALLGSIPPDKKLADLPIIARSLAPHERIGLMLAARDGAPPAFFADACRIMEDAIGREAFAPVAEAMKRAA